MSFGKLVHISWSTSRTLDLLLSLVQRYLGTRMAVFTLGTDYTLDNSRQKDNTDVRLNMRMGRP